MQHALPKYLNETDVHCWEPIYSQSLTHNKREGETIA